MMEERYQELKAAEKGAVVSILAYIFVSLIKLTVGAWANSDALTADGLNNLTDIIASVAVLIGLRLARRPADDDHRYGHWKVETVASLVTSFIMILIGGEVLISAVRKMLSGETEAPDKMAAVVGIVSAVIMVGVYIYNRNLATKVRSGALMAAAKDNLSDAYTSIGTAIAVFASSFHLAWLDSTAAVVVGILIIKTGIEIFRDSAFSLSDGFDEDLLSQYKETLMGIPGIKEVKMLRGRSYGSNIFLDVIVLMDPEITVEESHKITEEVEQTLQEKYQVFDTDVHVEPYHEKK